MFHDTHLLRPATPGFVASLAKILAATDRFIGWWGMHRAWPANEPARLPPPR